jgi:hypothetical protein
MKGGLKKMAGEGAAVHVTVDPLTSIIGVESNNPIKAFGSEFLFQESHFALLSLPPEAAIQILTRFPFAAVRVEAPRVADGVDEKLEEASQMSFLAQVMENL